MFASTGNQSSVAGTGGTLESRAHSIDSDVVQTFCFRGASCTDAISLLNPQDAIS